MNKEEHKQRHIDLHAALDELLADFVEHNKGTVLRRPIIDLMEWSHRQCEEPDELSNDL